MKRCALGLLTVAMVGCERPNTGFVSEKEHADFSDGRVFPIGVSEKSAYVQDGVERVLALGLKEPFIDDYSLQKGGFVSSIIGGDKDTGIGFYQMVMPEDTKWFKSGTYDAFDESPADGELDLFRINDGDFDESIPESVKNMLQYNYERFLIDVSNKEGGPDTISD